MLTRRLIPAVLAIMGCSVSAWAQQVAVSQVSGHVSDPSGQAIAGATVRMTETEKGLVHATSTDVTGRYELPNLPSGPYVLEVSAPGFKAYRQTGITLQVATNIDVPVMMQIGSVTESIEVSANAAMVETKENSISQVVDQRRIVDLPLNGRNLTQLLTLTGAGTTAPGGDLTGSKNIQGSAQSGTFAVAGSQANGVSYLLDGGDNNDAFSNVNLPIPFPDAVQEFSVQTNALPAQYGLHPGGVVNIVTKSGTNSFHGDVFEFLRNYDMNARQRATPARDSLKRSQFGGVAGGRIIKDKLFFFGGYQGTRQRSNPTAILAHVPTAAALNGDFSTLEAGAVRGRLPGVGASPQGSRQRQRSLPREPDSHLAVRPGSAQTGQELHSELERPVRGLLLRTAGQQSGRSVDRTHRLCAQRQAHDLRPVFHLRLHGPELLRREKRSHHFTEPREPRPLPDASRWATPTRSARPK